MDAVKFIKEHKRMCASYISCINCPMYPHSVKCEEILSNYTDEFTTKLTKTVEEWSAAHPRKTRQSIFLEQYPDAYTQYGVIDINPCRMVRNYTYKNCNIVDCSECRKEYWMQEVE